MYCHTAPCVDCAKAIANSGIKEIVIFNRYVDDRGIQILKKSGIKVKEIDF